MSSSVALAEAPTTRSAPLSILMASAIATKRESDISAAAREKLRFVCSISLPALLKRTRCHGPGRRRGWPLSEPVPARS